MTEITNWTEKELEILRELNTPIKIQGFINTLTYNPEYKCKSPRYVLKERTAHCM